MRLCRALLFPDPGCSTLTPNPNVSVVSVFLVWCVCSLLPSLSLVLTRRCLPPTTADFSALCASAAGTRLAAYFHLDRAGVVPSRLPQRKSFSHTLARALLVCCSLTCPCVFFSLCLSVCMCVYVCVPAFYLSLPPSNPGCGCLGAVSLLAWPRTLAGVLLRACC